MLDIGKDFYERHRDDCIEWGIPAPPTWEQLSAEGKAGWELMATEHAEKMLADGKDTP